MENFRISLFVDGQEKVPIDLDTIGKGSGFGAFIMQCDDGYFVTTIEIEGRVEKDGLLVVEVKNRNGSVIARSQTRRGPMSPGPILDESDNGNLDTEDTQSYPR